MNASTGKVPEHWHERPRGGGPGQPAVDDLVPRGKGMRKRKGKPRDFEGLKEVERFRDLKLYDYPTFQKLWAWDHLKEEAKALANFVKDGGGEVPVADAQAHMYRRGIIRRRLDRAFLQKARVRSRRKGPAGSPWVYELVSRPEPMSDSRAEQVLKSIFSAGQQLPDGRKQLPSGQARELAAAQGVFQSRFYRVFFEGLDGKSDLTPDGHGKLLSLSDDVLDREAPAGSNLPSWDDEHRELWFGGRIIKKFDSQPALRQVALIEAFEAAGWPPRIPNPFVTPGPEGRTIPDNDTLCDTCKNLNRSLPSGSIRFYRDGTGRGASWEPRQESVRRE
jgi:hypothetical protein